VGGCAEGVGTASIARAIANLISICVNSMRMLFSGVCISVFSYMYLLLL